MSRLKGRVRAAAASVAIASVAVIGLSDTASAASSASVPCGFSIQGSEGVWNNCTGPGWDYITIDIVWLPDYERCVKPGYTDLGAGGTWPDDIRGATFLHKC
jgi:hypothetical protein